MLLTVCTAGMFITLPPASAAPAAAADGRAWYECCGDPVGWTSWRYAANCGWVSAGGWWLDWGCWAEAEVYTLNTHNKQVIYLYWPAEPIQNITPPPSPYVISSFSPTPVLSITPSLFHSKLKTYLFHKSFPPWFIFVPTTGLISRISGPCINRFYLLFSFSFR